MNIARIGDEISCPNLNCRYPPEGPYQPVGHIIEGSQRMYAGGQGVARIGDNAICGGPCVLTTGSSRMFVEGRAVHRVTDMNSCNGNTVGPGYPQMLIAL